MRSKLKPEKREDARVVDDSGDVEDSEVVEGDVVAPCVNAVRSLRSELRGWSGWRRDGDILISDWMILLDTLGCLVVASMSGCSSIWNRFVELL